MAYDDSAANRLAAVRTAIGKCLNSQQYTAAGQMQQMAQLRDLRALEKDLQEEAAAEADGGRMATLGEIVPPTF